MRKKLLALFFAVVVAFQMTNIIAKATDVVSVPAEEVDSVLYQEVDSNNWKKWPKGPSVYSESAIVMDINSGAVLYAKNVDDKHYPASITKVLTALVALENTEMTDPVTFTWDDIGFLEYGDAHIGMKEGETITMEEAMYGMLLASANEVSHAIGSNTDGGYDNFIKLMNEKSAELGCKNSHWVNTYGLHDDEHYTSARDMAIISAAAFQYEEFRTITNTYQYVIEKTEITDVERYVHQNHKMIRDWDNRYYEYCVGGKTGYTDQALTTLVTFATKDDVNLVAVTLRTHGGGNNAYEDTKKILEYGFNNFSKRIIDSSVIEQEGIENLAQGAYIMLPEDITVEECKVKFLPPEEEGDYTGIIEYTYGGQPVGKIKATITETYYNEIHGIEPENEEKEQEKKEKKPVQVPVGLIIAAGVVLVFGIVFLILVIRVRIERKKREQRRKEARTRMREELQI